MEFIRRLPIPQKIKADFPISQESIRIKEARDAELKRILSGISGRFLLLVGPCSADNEASVIDYVSRLATLQEKVRDKILIVPRVYTNKPRTNGNGYKGMLHQPDPLLKEDMLEGVISVRKLHMKIIEETGLTCADELLYPENYRYLSDLLSYVAIGARSVENQQHRLVASGLEVPVGMKNPLSGNLNTLINSLVAAQHGHTFIYRGWEVITRGNPFAHAILRGETNQFGVSVPNYHYENINRLSHLCIQGEIKNMALIIDVNHSNSNKEYLEQPRICREIMVNRKASKQHQTFIKGLMIESYIEDGNQKADEKIYGKSITDACLGWDKTVDLILNIYNLL